MMPKPVATMDEAVPGHPRLVVELLPEQQAAVQEELDTLLEAGDGSKIQQIVSEALQAAAEQCYFWTQDWQAKEREADEAIAKGRVRTFDTMDQMLEFLDTK
jgi:hypothetical protein